MGVKKSSRDARMRVCLKLLLVSSILALTSVFPGPGTLASDAVPTEVDVMGIPPVTALVGDGRISAGFSQEGKLVTFFYPTVGAYDMVPYYTTKDPNPPYGAPERLGAFTGLVEFSTVEQEPSDVISETLESLGELIGSQGEGAGGNVTTTASVNWLTNKANISHEWDYPAFDFLYQTNYADIAERVFSVPDMDAVAYVVTVTNTSNADREFGFAYYGLFDPGRVNQNPLVMPVPGVKEATPGTGWQTQGQGKARYVDGKLLWWKEGVDTSWIGVSSDLGAGSLMHVDAAEASVNPLYSELFWGQSFEVSNGVYRTESQSYECRTPQDGTTWEKPCLTSLLCNGALNGVMIWDLGNIPAGQSKPFCILVAAGSNENEVVRNLDDILQKNHINTLADYSLSLPDWLKEVTAKWWRVSLLDKLDYNLDGMYESGRLKDNHLSDGDNDEDERLLRWWAINLRLMADRGTGAIVACPTLIPKYYGSWPRDGTYQALTWMALGFDDVARSFLDYLFSNGDFQREGRWYQCYSSTDPPEYVGFPGVLPDCQELGIKNGKVIEEDQMCLVMLANWYYRNTFTSEPTGQDSISRLAEYINQAIEPREGDEEDRKVGISYSAPPPFDFLKVEQSAATIKRGLIRPSSDAYELPGNIIEGEQWASRQASTTSFEASSALVAANEMLGAGQFADSACDLRDRAEEIFYKSESADPSAPPHFYVAWDIFGAYLYDRPGDLSTAVAWPVQAYPLTDNRLVNHYNIVRNLYVENPPDRNGRKRNLFSAGALMTQFYYEVHRNIAEQNAASGATEESAAAGGFWDRFNRAVDWSFGNDEETNAQQVEPVPCDFLSDIRRAAWDPSNDYIPEFAPPDTFSGGSQGSHVACTQPLGWAQAMGIMVLLAKAGYIPPEMPHPCDPIQTRNYVIFLVDVSTSMSWEAAGSGGKLSKLDKVKAAVPNIIRELSTERNAYALLTYSCPDCSTPSTPVLVEFTQDPQVIVDAVQSLQPYGWTPMVAGIDAAYKYAERIPQSAAGNIILLADGQQNCPGGQALARDDIMIEVREIPGRPNIKMSTIAYGTEGDRNLTSTLADLANQRGGVFMNAPDPESVKGGFREVILSRSMPEDKLVTGTVFTAALLFLLFLALL